MDETPTGTLAPEAASLLLGFIETFQFTDESLLTLQLDTGQPFSLPKLTRELEERFIERAIRISKGNLTEAGDLLGMNRTTVSMRVKNSRKLTEVMESLGDGRVTRNRVSKNYR
jgi:DNA-binding NtrC family response regulator